MHVCNAPSNAGKCSGQSCWMTARRRDSSSLQSFKYSSWLELARTGSSSGCAHCFLLADARAAQGCTLSSASIRELHQGNVALLRSSCSASQDVICDSVMSSAEQLPNSDTSAFILL